jgi:hypothetical protein
MTLALPEHGVDPVSWTVLGKGIGDFPDAANPSTIPAGISAQNL